LSGPSISRQKNILRVSTETSFEIKLKQITEKLTLDGSLASKNNEGTLNQYSKNLFQFKSGFDKRIFINLRQSLSDL